MIKQTAMQRFLLGVHNRQLFPGFICFCMAGLGAALGFLADSLQAHLLGLVAFAITVVGVAGGFVFIAFRWYQLFTKRGQQS